MWWSIQTNSLLAIDIPAANSIVLHTFYLAGWAIDYAAAGGTGVSTIHVWAYPVGGGAPQFVGVAQYGDQRPDVAAAYGPQPGRKSCSRRPTGLPW